MDRPQITDDTRLADLTITEFKNLLRDTMDTAAWEFISRLPDSDEGKQLKPEVEKELQERLKKGDYLTAEDVLRELGLDTDE